VKIKLCVSSTGVHLKAMTLSYSDNVSSVENEEQQSKDVSLWYTTKNGGPDKLSSGKTDGLHPVADK